MAQTRIAGHATLSVIESGFLTVIAQGVCFQGKIPVNRREQKKLQ